VAKALYIFQRIVIMRKYVNAYYGRSVFFSGSSAILRRQAVEEAGGWQGDTLSEDSDLSIRMQFKGWHGTFIECNPGCEWPEDMYSAKQQQGRWACGNTHVLRKYFFKVLFAKKPLLWKCDLMVDMTAFLLTLFTLIQMLATWPLLTFSQSPIAHHSALIAFIVLMVILIMPVVIVGKSLPQFHHMNPLLFFLHYYFLSCALTVHMAFHTFKGLLGMRGDFFKVPKLGDQTKKTTEAPPIVTRKTALFFFLELSVYGYLAFSIIALGAEGYYAAALGQLIFFTGFSYGLYRQFFADRHSEKKH
jgi:cellulose synthase/poly-beta-1,6-N-acetylglucosamine synthase-like glycosyltransferase